jgi:hypothetical protein
MSIVLDSVVVGVFFSSRQKASISALGGGGGPSFILAGGLDRQNLALKSFWAYF